MILVLRAGAATDSAGREGLAAMTADMLDEAPAAGRVRARRRDRRLPGRDGRRRLGVGRPDGACGSGRPADEALSLMADVALRPDFPKPSPSGWASTHRPAAARDSSGAIAARALAGCPAPRTATASRRSAAPSRSPRSRSPTRSTRHAAPSAATLVVVGDASASVLPSLERRSALEGCLRHAGAGTRPGGAVADLLVDKKGRAVSLRLGRVGPAWPDPAYAANQVMNTLLGGSFTSRLNDNLRERTATPAGELLPPQPHGGSSRWRRTCRPTRPAPRSAKCHGSSGSDAGCRGQWSAQLRRARLRRRLRDDGPRSAHGRRSRLRPPDGFTKVSQPKALAVDGAALQQAARGATGRRSRARGGGRSREVEAPLRAESRRDPQPHRRRRDGKALAISNAVSRAAAFVSERQREARGEEGGGLQEEPSQTRRAASRPTRLARPPTARARRCSSGPSPSRAPRWNSSRRSRRSPRRSVLKNATMGPSTSSQKGVSAIPNGTRTAAIRR